MENIKRQPKYQKIAEVEKILTEINQLISDPVDRVFNSFYPILFIVGCARSGTTLLSQYLASTEIFCYPSNLISRFYYAPYLGSLLQKLFVDLDHKGELLGSYIKEIDFRSDLGKTKGILSPHEFWYYWRQFFHFDEIQKLSDDALSDVDIYGFVNGLKAIQEVFDKPLFLKAIIVNWNIPYLAENIPEARFLFVKRNKLYNAQSILLARETFFGNDIDWYSFKPPEYDYLLGKSSEEQVIAQVYFTNKAIEEGLKQVSPERIIEVEYEQFCKDTSSLLLELDDKFSLPIIANPIPSFKIKNNINVSSQRWKALKAYNKYYKGLNHF